MSELRWREAQERIDSLQRERDELEAQLRAVADANARAALHMAERNEELERQGRELQKALEEAEEASSKKNEFLAKVSHELRTPLNGILGMARFLFDTRLTEVQHEYASTVLESAESLLEIINDLLDVSRIAAPEFKLDCKPFDVWKITEDVVRLLTPKARAKGLRLNALLDPALPRRIVTDPGRLRQALVNLCNNAVKFTEAGSVTVRASVDEDGACVRFDVVDTGCGIADSDVHRLFMPFEQIDNSATRKHGGTGLGLAISRGLVTAMGGSVVVTSQVDRGSTFTIRLPLVAVEDPAPPPAVFEACTAVVSDVCTRKAIVDHLAALGVRVDAFATWSEASRELARTPFGDRRLVLLAIEDLDGRDRADVLRALGEELKDSRSVLLHPLQGMPDEAFEPLGVLRLPLRATELHSLAAGCWEATSVGPRRTTLDLGGEVHAGLSVLLVEDSPVNQRVGRLLLERMGCKVTLAENGAECLAKLGKDAFELVLMDCQMPVMDGYEATRRIRALTGDTAHVPVIALTASVTVDDRARCTAAGMDDHLGKPIDVDELRERLRRWSPRGGDVDERRAG